MSQGARIPGTQPHANTENWIVGQLKKSGWYVEIQDLKFNQKPIQNIIGKRGDKGPLIIIGAHYDSRPVADQDPVPENKLKPVPGANDGASGVAVLLELGRVLPKDLDKRIWLVFFDAEDGGNIAGSDWILGSRAFVEKLVDKPDAAIVIDMIGDKDLNLFYELNSDNTLSQSIWQQALDLGYKQFIMQPKYRMLDDHIPFIQAGISAVDIIDFDYPYWHTTQDTPDKVSVESLHAVGDTLLRWLEKTSR